MRKKQTGVIDDLIDDLFGFDQLAVFMKAYFDESGKHPQATVISIFGLLLSAKTCKELQRRWFREAAKSPTIPLPFHMSDCVAGAKSFAYLKDDEATRFQMQERMIRTLRGLDAQGYGMCVVRADYLANAEKLRKSEKFRDPWFFAFETAITEMMLASEAAGKKHSISLVFDRQDEFSARAHELYDEIVKETLSFSDRLGSLSFSPKDKVAALQAADVVVYEATKYLAEHRLGNQPERWQSKLLRKMIHVDGRILDAYGVKLIGNRLTGDDGCAII